MDVSFSAMNRLRHLVGAFIPDSGVIARHQDERRALARPVLAFVNDVILTPEEVDGLMANLLISKEPARGKLVFKDWLISNRDTIGTKYASEIKKHYA